MLMLLLKRKRERKRVEKLMLLQKLSQKKTKALHGKVENQNFSS